MSVPPSARLTSAVCALTPGAASFHRGGCVDPVQHDPRQERVVVGEVAGQRLDQNLTPGLQVRGGQLGQHLRMTGAADQRLEHPAPGDTEEVGHHRRELDPAVVQQVLQPPGLVGAFAHHIGAISRQVAQLPNRRRRHEADQTVFDQLGVPLGVLHVGLAARGGLHVAGVDRPSVHQEGRTRCGQGVAWRPSRPRQSRHRESAHPGPVNLPFGRY